MNNKLDGIGAAGQSAPTLQANECSENTRSGIVFAAHSAGVVTANTCAYNANNGITVQDQAQRSCLPIPAPTTGEGSSAAVSRVVRSAETAAPRTR